MISAAQAMQIREYVPARHDRFTGFPSTPVVNGAAWFAGNDFTGVGWLAANTKRQLVLVSPKHVLIATHTALANTPGPGSVIRFLNASGTVVERTLASYTVIQNGGQNTDLALGTLTQPLLPGDGVTPLPYLNLSDENSYQHYRNCELAVFGWDARVGRGVLTDTLNVTLDGQGTTRMSRFYHVHASGHPDDARLESGDSGSPSFAWINGAPALVGIHSAISTSDPDVQQNFDAFIPHFIADLDTLMAADNEDEEDDFQMAPANSASIRLVSTPETTPEVLLRGMPGSWTFRLANTTLTAADDVKLTLTFPAGSAPDTVSGLGWTAMTSGPLVWVFQRAQIAGEDEAEITATWPELPDIAVLDAELTHEADDCPRRVDTHSQPLAPSYAQWSAGLSEPETGADPDGDGISNLLEYAFGGDPEAASRFSPEGHLLMPELHVEDGTAVLTFPVRDDAELRWLSYIVEWSATLEAESWTTDEPDGFSQEDGAFDPAVPGFSRRVVSFTASPAPRMFCRVRVVLTE